MTLNAAFSFALLAACQEPTSPDLCRGEGALAECSRPTQPPEHYVDQALRYFDTLDGSADPNSVPTYAEGVARWEWPPWLKLTGLGAEMIAAADRLVLVAQPDNTVPERDCRFFERQPFARCHVVMIIEDKPCPIYEEFAFDPQGLVTWVEAWSDLPGLGPAADDPWGDSGGVHRLSTRIPGLGSTAGRIALDSDAMRAAAAEDVDVADFVTRAADFWGTWAAELEAAGDDLYVRGCGWEAP